MSAKDFSQELLPHNKFAEQAILGALILKNDVLDDVSHLLPTDFFSPAHQHIYQGILELSENQHPIDEVTLGSWLHDRQLLDQTGGAPYLVELAQSTPAVENIQYYAGLVKEKAKLRTLISTAADISKKGLQSTEDAESIIVQASQALQELEGGENQKGAAHLKQILLHQFEVLEERAASTETVTGVPSGFRDLDDLTLGFQPGDLVILAARPSMGKTALALNMCLYAAMHCKEKKGVLVFSLEMPKEHLAMRMLCSESKVDSHKLRLGSLDEQDWDSLATAAAKLTDANLFIDDQAAATPANIRKTARQVHAKCGLQLIVVDYMQLMHGSSRYNSREQEISEISHSLKAVAKEYNIPVIALSQLNRDLERRADKRPIMADLRESGSIEQDADIIMFIYRDEVYNEATEEAGIAELIVAKHRNGEIGTKKVAFIGKYTKFANLNLQDDPYAS